MHDTTNGAALLATARDFQPRIIAQREAIETSRRLPEDLARDLARAGFFRIFLPAAYGGLDLTPMDGIAVFEELAKADASVAWCVWNGNAHWIAAQLSSEAAHAIHEDPDVIRANGTRPSGHAHVIDGGLRLTGRWSAAASSQPGWFCSRRFMKTASRAKRRRVAQRSAACCCPPANAKSSTRGQ